MKERESLNLAVEALEKIASSDYRGNRSSESVIAFKTLEAIKEALAQPEQEPVAWMEKDVLPLTHIIKAIVRREKDETYTEPLYITPPQRTWVGLTDDELNEWTPEIHVVIRAIEAKLKEKNNG